MNKKNNNKNNNKKKKKGKKGSKKRKRLPSELLGLTRVDRMTSGGRRLRFRAVMAVGDKNGKIGLGVGKAKTVRDAIFKAKRVAKKNMVRIPLTDEKTIKFPVEGEFNSSHVLLKPKKTGSLVAGGAVRVVCDLLGIERISAKIISRSRNPLNVAKATLTGLEKLKL